MSWSPSSLSSGSGSDMDDEGAEAYRKGGYLAVRVGDRFKGGRYVAQRKLGWGHFSTVWLAYDTHTSEFVALKIQKSAVEFAEAAHHEIKVLSAIADGDPSNSKCIARLVNEFKHAGPNGRHICLVLEFLGDSLLKLIRYNRYRGIGLDRVREVCRFILIGLDYLHRELGIIHSDLKPENVLLVSTIDPAKDPVLSGLTPILERPEGYRSSGISSMIEKKLKSKARRASAKLLKRRHSVVTLPEKGRSLEGIDLACKIVDFGNACWANDPFSDEIQTRQYRSPEVVLCSGYSFPVDMWSLGCIAFELATGDMLFNPTCGYGYSEDEVMMGIISLYLLPYMAGSFAPWIDFSKISFSSSDGKQRVDLAPQPIRLVLAPQPIRLVLVLYHIGHPRFFGSLQS